MSQSYARITIRLETMTPQEPDEKGYKRSDEAARTSEIILCAGDEGTAVLMAQSHIGVLADYYAPGAVTA